MEPYERVYVSDKTFLTSTHNAQGCTFCHRGDNTADDLKKAHEGIIRSPDEKADICAQCHADIVDLYRAGLHKTTGGMKNILAARWNPERRGEGPKDLNTIFDKHCYSCHASCGDCHVNRPKGPAKGGFLAGHKFLKNPPEDMTCEICHSARIGDEYYGQNPGAPADTHIRIGGMGCGECHNKKNALHGGGKPVLDRYEDPLRPDCKECHRDVLQGKNRVEQHEIHGDKLQCNVCHSVFYKNCKNCHLEYKEEKGRITDRFFKIDPSFMTFKIGKNYRKDRPYQYVVLRHPPASRDLASAYGSDMMSNFDELPTWKYATPHNIQRLTPQNKSCDSCHGNDALFLRKVDVDPKELTVSGDVIVDHAPEKTGRKQEIPKKGNAYYEKGDFKDAVIDLRRAITKDPGNRELWREYNDAYQADAATRFMTTLTGSFNAISYDEFIEREKLNPELFVIDLRSPADYKEEHVPAAVNIPLEDIRKRLNELPELKIAEIVVYCAGGPRSATGQMYLSLLGYTNVKYLRGGMFAWKEGKEKAETQKKQEKTPTTEKKTKSKKKK